MVMRRRSRYVLLKARKAFGVNSNPVLAKNILYIPIPKNANSYFTSIFIYNDNNCKDFDPRKESAIQYWERTKNHSTRYRSLIPPRLNKKIKQRFVIVREPGNRIVSCFVDKFVKINQKSIVYAEVSKVLAKKIRPEQFTFRDFIKFVEAIPERFRNPHYSTQATFIPKDIREEELFRLEDGRRIEKFLVENGFDFPPNPEDFTPSARKVTEYSELEMPVADMPVCKLRDLSRLPCQKSFLTSDLKKSLDRIYKEDFDIYNRMT